MIERDQKNIWHPYTQHGLNPEILPIARAKGAYLELIDGRKILDGISSWWVNIHGHGHSEIAKAIHEQASKLDHAIFAGFTHEPAIELAEVLLNAARDRDMVFDRVFYSDNGSTAVEVALKMAFQFHKNLGRKKRNKFIALYGAYHGDTLGAMAVGEPDGFHTIFKKLLPEVDFVHANDISELELLIQKNPEDYAGFIFEPMVQGASGMKFYDGEYLKLALALCKKHEILCIADEVFTGFYRTGKLFASEHAEISPDIMCLSKGITGGTLPLALTMVANSIYLAFKNNDLKQAFLHGHSYTANPIACAAALASWKLLQNENCQIQIKNISLQTKELVLSFRSHPKVKDARSLGTIGAIELNLGANYFTPGNQKISKMAVDRGVLLRPLGNVLYAVPPYCVTSVELQKIYSVIGEIIHEL